MNAPFRPVFGEHPHFVDCEVPVGVVQRFKRALATRRQRRALMALDDRTLADIGISRSEAYREANRAFFDLPRQ